jgi:hypothetical protein
MTLGTIVTSLAVGALTGLVAYAPAPAQQVNRDAALIFEGKLPPDYRDWRLIARTSAANWAARLMIGMAGCTFNEVRR